MNAWQQLLDFEPFLRLLDIQAELLWPDEVVMHEESQNLQAAWDTKKRARPPVQVELIDATSQIVTLLMVECLVLPRS